MGPGVQPGQEKALSFCATHRLGNGQALEVALRNLTQAPRLGRKTPTLPAELEELPIHQSRCRLRGEQSWVEFSAFIMPGAKVESGPCVLTGWSWDDGGKTVDHQVALP